MKVERVDQRLFIYGTLAPGCANHHVMENIPGEWQPGCVSGNLIAAGWGAAMGCPGISLTDDGDSVDGVLFTSIELPEHWQMLDDFEGDGYRRVEVRVTLEGGNVVDAYIYELNL